MNPIHPKLLSAAERRAEIADLLATAILRLRARQDTQKKQETPLKGLDCQGVARLHAAGVKR
jgi:hypothetical protein